MKDNIKLQESSIPSLDVGSPQIIPTVEDETDVIENSPSDVENGESEEEKSELIESPKKTKKFANFGKSWKDKIKTPKSKRRKDDGGNDPDSIVDDLVIERTKIVNEEEVSEMDSKDAADDQTTTNLEEQDGSKKEIDVEDRSNVNNDQEEIDEDKKENDDEHNNVEEKTEKMKKKERKDSKKDSKSKKKNEKPDKKDKSKKKDEKSDKKDKKDKKVKKESKKKDDKAYINDEKKNTEELSEQEGDESDDNLDDKDVKSNKKEEKLDKKDSKSKKKDKKSDKKEENSKKSDDKSNKKVNDSDEDTKGKKKFSFGNKLKLKSKIKKKDTDGDALLEDKKVQLGNDSEVLDEEEDVEDEVDDEEDASEGDESIDEDEPYVEDSKMQANLHSEPPTQGKHIEPPLLMSESDSVSQEVSVTSSKAASAREARREARAKLLVQMEAEGKLKQSKGAKVVESPLLPDISTAIGEVTKPVPRRERRQKRGLPARELPPTNESPAPAINIQSDHPQQSQEPQELLQNDGDVSSGKQRRNKKAAQRRNKKAALRDETEIDGGVLSDKTDDNVVISNKAVVASDLDPDVAVSERPIGSTMKKSKPNKKSKGGPDKNEASELEQPAPTVLSSPAVRKLESAMSIKVHYAEHLYPTLYLLHPLVKIHLLDSKTGNYLPSTLGDERFSTIQPILTEAFDLRHHKTMSPCWEEQILIPETYESIIENENAMVFFEIVDIVPARALKKHKSGWNHIAWAFLKLKSGQGGFNVDRKLRLQLYKYPVVEQSASEIFMTNSRTKYPSTVYVTIGNITDKTVLSSLYVDQIAAQNPALSQYIDNAVQNSNQASSQVEVKDTKPTWSRAPGQMCKIPKTKCFEIPTPELGCLLMAFSSDGRFLACGCVAKASNPILVYSIPDGTLLYTLYGHYNIVYDLKWYKSALLSASSDCTARIWRNGEQEKQMSHPAFVYTAKWIDKRKVVTGSYDRVIRIWDTNCAGENCALLAQLHGHLGHVNSIAVKGSDTIYSGDSRGQVIEWSGAGASWTQSETIHPPEMQDVPISQLLLHPNKRRMFIQSRDNHVRLLDLRIRAITQRYTGHTNTREHIRCSVSPCGTYVLSASEDGEVFVWLVETGEASYTYKTGIPHSTSDVKFHPHDNFAAISAFGSAQPVVFYKRVEGVQDPSKLDGTVKMDAIKEKLLTVSPSTSHNLLLSDKLMASKLKLPGLSSGLVQSTPLAQPGLSITLTPGATQITGLPPTQHLKLKIIHDYTPQRSDEISLVTGDQVKLNYIDTDGWWVGENSAGERGYFPSNYVEQPTSAQSMTFRSLNHTLNTPRTKRRIDFNMSMTNGENEWQTFDTNAMTSRSPAAMSDNESIASSNRSASRRRHTTAKVGSIQVVSPNKQ